MTIKYLDSKRLSGVSGDTKPTNVQDNSIFVETNTDRRYWFDGTDWTIESPPTTGLKLWLDASDSTTITKDGSNLISVWHDKSGQLNHVTQATATKQPLWVDAVQNSKPIIRFDGVDNCIRRETYTGGTLTQPTTIFIVCSMPSTGLRVFDSALSSSRHVFWKDSNNYHNIFSGSILTDSTTVSTSILQYTVLYNTTASNLRKSQVSILSGDSGSNTMTGITLAAEHNGTTSFAAIDIAEVLIYNTTLSTTDRDDIEQYLAKKWGL